MFNDFADHGTMKFKSLPENIFRGKWYVKASICEMPSVNMSVMLIIQNIFDKHAELLYFNTEEAAIKYLNNL